MSYRGYRRYGAVRRRAPYRRRAAYRPMRRILPRRRVLSRLPAGLYGGRGATEMKSVDTDLYTSSTQLTQAGSIRLAVVPPVNGAAFYQRIGTRTRAVSLELRGMIVPSNSNAAAVTRGFGRILIVYDRQPNGALPTVAEVLADYSSAGATATTALSGLNLNNRDRFLVLRDRKLILPAIGAGGAAGTAQGIVLTPGDDNESLVFREFIKLKGLESHYKLSNGNVGDIATGSFLIIALNSVDADVTFAGWTCYLESRFKFFD